MDWSTAHSWQFLPLDDAAFPAVRLAREVGTAGGCLPAVYNAANEECVHAFHGGRLPFTGIVDTLTRVVEAAGAAELREPGTVDDVLAADRWARETARAFAFGTTQRPTGDRTGY
jgi:1-deoxy-D-xylulose-5-phosphate reductoisomerase